MKSKSPAKERHDSLCALVLAHVLAKPCEYAIPNWTYDLGPGLKGELDIFVKHPSYWVYYEIKSTHRTQSYRKAKKQYRRVCEAYPERVIKGVYVTPTKVRRL